jgi:hypothetical protein
MKKNDAKKKFVKPVNAIEIKGTKKKVIAKILSDIEKEAGREKSRVTNSRYQEYVAWDEEASHSEVIHGDT